MLLPIAYKVRDCAVILFYVYGVNRRCLESDKRKAAESCLPKKTRKNMWFRSRPVQTGSISVTFVHVHLEMWGNSEDS